MKWGPALNLEVLNVACWNIFRVTPPKTDFPSLKVTIPAGGPAVGAASFVNTEAVKVTGCPNTEAEGARKLVRVLARFIN